MKKYYARTWHEPRHGAAGNAHHGLWDTLNEEQKKTLMKRMLDTKIMMKEGMIKHFQYKIETFKMIKTMLDEC